MEKWMSQTFWLYDLTVLAILILCVCHFFKFICRPFKISNRLLVLQ